MCPLGRSALYDAAVSGQLGCATRGAAALHGRRGWNGEQPLGVFREEHPQAVDADDRPERDHDQRHDADHDAGDPRPGTTLQQADADDDAGQREDHQEEQHSAPAKLILGQPVAGGRADGGAEDDRGEGVKQRVGQPDDKLSAVKGDEPEAERRVY